MGFLDVLNGMKNGPRGPSKPGESGGMSPITMAILAYLAYKGIKHVGGSMQNTPAGTPRLPGGNPTGPGSGGGTLQADAGGGLGDILGGLLGGGRGPTGSGRTMQTGGGGLDDILGGLLGGGRAAAPSGGAGGMGDLLKGGLGGLLAGGAAGSILSGGLGSLLEQFQQNGQGQAAQSWVGRGENQDISESDLARSIGADDLDALSRHFGVSQQDLLSGLRRELPNAIDEMTPDGRLRYDLRRADPAGTARRCSSANEYQALIRSDGTLPPLAASFCITCLCSQMFIEALSLESPV